jgi:hypothetical protein
MKKSRLLGAVYACLLFIVATPALASVVYSYAGNPFNSFSSATSYSSSNLITGTVVLENLLQANSTSQPTILSFSFTDGVQTLTEADAAIDIFEFTTDGDSITNWRVSLQTFPAPLVRGDVVQIIRTYNWDVDVKDAGNRQTVAAMIGNTPIFRVDSGERLTTTGLWVGDVAIVPLPATAWLFGSGLLGLIGLARHKKKT